MILARIIKEARSLSLRFFFALEFVRRLLLGEFALLALKLARLFGFLVEVTFVFSRLGSVISTMIFFLSRTIFMLFANAI
ncbi:hypothetical protein D3C87_1787780 [compost metagenome]